MLLPQSVRLVPRNVAMFKERHSGDYLRALWRVLLPLPPQRLLAILPLDPQLIARQPATLACVSAMALC